MKKENMKKYEAPLAKVTCLKTEDVIMASEIQRLSEFVPDNLMGSGKVKYIDIE